MSSEASKITKAYKVSPETKEKLEKLFEGSGIATQEGFIEHIATLYEMQLLKEGGAAGYKKQLDELEYHSRRSVELFLGMIETESSERLQISQQHEETLANRTATIYHQEQEITELKKELKQQSDESNRLTKESDAQSKQIEQLQEISRKDNLLVEEYRQKVDTLSGLVNDYKAASEENHSLKIKVTELTSISDRKSDRIGSLEEELQMMDELREEQLRQLEERHKNESSLAEQRYTLEKERAIEKAENQKERELMALQTNLQSKASDQIANLQNKASEQVERYTAEIRELYAKIDEQRSSHEQYVSALRSTLEAEMKSQKESYEADIRELRKK